MIKHIVMLKLYEEVDGVKTSDSLILLEEKGLQLQDVIRKIK